ncbi:hypothetical protein BH09PSE4_BH09PSE4_22670 [soil metagenome]
MEIHLYSITWNEAAILPFFFRHYDRFVDRYFLFDDGSDDGTLAILAQHPRVTVRPLPRPFDSYLQSATHLRNHAWKDSRGVADWVIATDIDEHFYHPDMRGYLESCRAAGVTCIPGLGYQMLTDTFPDQQAELARDHRMGAPFDDMHKIGIYNPDAIEETGFVTGRHFGRPTGRVIYPARDEVLNLHYKYLGLDFVDARQQDLIARVGSNAHDQVTLPHWGVGEEQLRSWIAVWSSALVDVTDPAQTTLRRHRDPHIPSWWRAPPWWRLRPWHLQYWWRKAPPWTRHAIGRTRRLLRLPKMLPQR